MKLPEALKEFSLTLQLDDYKLSDFDLKSLYENIVDSKTAKEFILRGDNFKEIQSILDTIELFDRNNFGRLWSMVDEIAKKNKEYHNINYKLLNITDPFHDNFATLSVNGWKQHIFNIIYGVRSDPKHYESWHSLYVRWKKCYDIVRSGSDPDGLYQDLYDLGF
jgi:hypothetical protein